MDDTSSDLTLEEIEEITARDSLKRKALKLARENIFPFPTEIYLSLCYALGKDPERNGMNILCHVETGEQVPAEDMGIEVEEGREYYLVYSTARKTAEHCLDMDLEAKYPRMGGGSGPIPWQGTPLQALTNRQVMEQRIEDYKNGLHPTALANEIEKLFDCDIYMNGIPLIDFVFGGVRRERRRDVCTCPACQIKRMAEQVLGGKIGDMTMPPGPQNPNLLGPGDDDRDDFMDLLGGGGEQIQ